MKEDINLFNNTKWDDAPEYSEDTKKRILHGEKGTKTLLLKLPEGFNMPPHSHRAAEQHVILKGDYISDGKVYHAGTYQNFKAHEDHGPFESKHGALVLVIWDPCQAET